LKPVFNSLVAETLGKYPCPDTQRAKAEKVLDMMFTWALSPQLSPSPVLPMASQLRLQNPLPLDPSEPNHENQFGKVRGTKPLSSDSSNEAKERISHE
jgi:hypothetical protein